MQNQTQACLKSDVQYCLCALIFKLLAVYNITIIRASQ